MKLSQYADPETQIGIEIDQSKNRAIFHLQGKDTGPYTSEQLATAMIEGKFPDYRAIIPKSSTVHTKMDRAGFTQQIKVARLFAKDSANNVG